MEKGWYGDASGKVGVRSSAWRLTLLQERKDAKHGKTIGLLDVVFVAWSGPGGSTKWVAEGGSSRVIVSHAVV